MRYKGLVITACVLGWICTNTSNPADANVPNTNISGADTNVPEVNFVVSREKAEKNWGGKRLTSPNGITPLFAVEIELPSGILTPIIRDNYSEMYYSKSFKSMSKEQRKYVQSVIIVTWDDNKCVLYAVSEKDVKLMVNAFFEMVSRAYQKEMAGRDVEIQKRTKELKNAEDKLAELKNLEEKKTKFKYISADEAKSQAIRFGMIQEEMAVEMAGLEGKLQAIDKVIEKGQTGNDIGSLDKIRVNTIIDLATAKSKQTAANGKRAESQEAYDLLSKYESIEKDKDSYKATVEVTKDTLAKLVKQQAEIKTQFESYTQTNKTVLVYPLVQN